MVSRSQHGFHKPKELRRFYEPLGVLHELTMKGASKPRSIFSTSARGISIMQRRRDFVDAIAYIGAYRKGCEIAVAVERRPDALFVRVAGTAEIDKIVVPFLNNLLPQLSIILKHSAGDIKDDLNDKILVHLSDMVLDFGQEKIFAHYMKILQHIAPICLADMITDLNEADRDNLNFKAWFQDNFYKNGAPLLQEHMKPLARECLNAQQSGMFDLLREFTYQGHKHVTYFEKFYKQLRKLSLTIDMTSQLLESTISLRQDLANEMVARSLPSSPSLPIPLLPRKLSVEGIANRMFSNSSKRNDFLQKLQQIAPPGLSKTLVHYSQTVLTQVHPELLVMNYFDALSDGGFIDENDKYIGCTKPSCYLCHLFISYHPARYSSLSSNSKICLNWRLPDISREEYNAMARVENQKSILQQLINTIRNQLEEKVKNEWILQPHCAESEIEWMLPVDDDTFDYSPQPSSPQLTPASPIVSTGLITPRFDIDFNDASGSGTDGDQDAEDVVLFKGRGRF
ncbi:hypothetical protein BDW59DRAFT_171218 [Aspergillus cavernicola]|uniref:Uncharacterized protein n=1 Tax=Aspergillus cavernicola TaxID=176166 RepID=A0ABR4IKK6_9EURO